MLINRILEELAGLDRMARKSVEKLPRKRFLYKNLSDIATQTRQFVGIAGLRGSGKTVLVKQLASSLPHTFYLSADTLPANTSLFDLATALQRSFGIKHLMIDEIHALSGWQGQLKKLYDFHEVKVVFTSSSSLELNETRYDLSRRLTLLQLPLFSFREYLAFSKNTEIPVYTLEDIIKKPDELYRKIYPFEADFVDYCTTGAMPACLDSPLPSMIVSIIDKVIQKDLISVCRLSQEDLISIRSVLLFIARAGIEGVSYSSVSKNTAISKYKAQQYIGLLNSASLLRIILPNGANVLAEPKILLSPCLRMVLSQGADPDRMRGSLREEFFIHHMTGTGRTINYLKNMRGEKLPDYCLIEGEKKMVFEIGGAGKTARQFKGTQISEKIILNQPGTGIGIPLLLTGFLW